MILFRSGGFQISDLSIRMRWSFTYALTISNFIGFNKILLLQFIPFVYCYSVLDGPNEE